MSAATGIGMRAVVAVAAAAALLMAGVAAAEEEDPGLLCAVGPCNLADYDGDTVLDWADNCPLNGNTTQKDNDKDTPAPIVDAGEPPGAVGEKTGALRIYPSTPYQTGQTLPTDMSREVGGDACDLDDDNDGIYDRKAAGHKGPDNCHFKPNPNQEDADGDGMGDACDPDTRPIAAPVAKAAKVSVRRPRSIRYDALLSGLIVRVKCSAACDVAAELTLDRRSGRGVRVSGDQLVIGRGTAHLDGAGTTYLIVRIPQTSLRNLSRRAGRLRALLRVERLVAAPRTVSSTRIVLHR